MKQRMKKAISLQKGSRKGGYKYAFENYDLKVPAKYERNELLKKWFTEGFKSNKKQRKFEKKGIKGRQRFSFFYKSFVPSEYKEHKELYEQAIEKVKQHKKMRRNSSSF